MRTLSSTLLAAQKATSGVPYVEVKVSNRVANITRLRWASQYSASLPDDEHGAAADASYLHRVRVRAGTPQYERNAGSGWSALSAGTDASRIAIAAVNNQRVMVVYNRAAAIYYRESTDQGASFGSETLILTLSATPAALAVAYKNTTGDLAVIWEEGNNLKRIRRTSGAFGSAATWTRSVNSINGVTVQHSGDFHIVLTGTDTSNRPVVSSTVLGDGFFYSVDTWAALQQIAEAETGSNVSFGAPSLAVLDTYRLVFVESYSGTTAYRRPQWTWFPPSQTFVDNAWREPVPFDLDSDKGVAITGNTSTAYLSRPDRTWSASLSSPSTDLTDDVLELALQLRRYRGQARVTLRNDDGRYNNLLGGGYSVITHGAQLEVSPGYRTANGNEKSSGLKFWIDRIEHTSEGGKATLVLHASDAWALVERWRARRQHHWAAGDDSVSQIMRFVFGRAAIELQNVGVSSTAISHRPRFTIHPGEDGVQAVRRLLAMLPDTARIAGELAYLSEPKTADASVYTYGTGHAIFRARHASQGLAANRAQVFGSGVLSERFDWPDIQDQFDRLRQVFDLNMTTATKADQRAQDTLRQEGLELILGELLTPANCGQELGDVIAVTDPNVGLSAQKYRVVGLDLSYARGPRAVYEQRLMLGEV
ncbi:MAG: hypothetical protein A2148_12495 [Chloroflexi bacterium RBG_16_68_14]|nr:MAG: hypothetical protein A2148_12495 [Chloroflexi bacterium RBG_16_68_14]